MKANLVGLDVAAGIRRAGSVRPYSATQVKVPLRAGAAGMVSSAHRSIRHHNPGAGAGTVSAPRAPGEGRIRAMTCGAQPNKRVKLAAPALVSNGFRSPGRFATIPFVNVLIRRRSLRAFR